jgi:formylglycine-generating enzyme required for sulfatase activity
MHFINSILLFFAFLLLGPALLSTSNVKEKNFIEIEAKSNDPYAETKLIRGGTFAMGMNQENIMGEWNNSLRRVTVSSFRLDQYEVSNLKYRTYLNWLEKQFLPLGRDSIVKAAFPDTAVWKTELSFNDPMVKSYFRKAVFNDYPVVGVSWIQARNYCRWRTDRANEQTLLKLKLIDPKKPYLGSMGVEIDNTDSNNLQNNTKNSTRSKTSRSSSLVDVLVPDFRLPTEAEWEYAAKVNVVKVDASGFELPKSGSNAAHPNANLVTYVSPYPWSSNGNEGLRNTTKDKNKGSQGMFLANFKNGSGDYMGMIGYANDGAGFPTKVNSFLQNEIGLYNISGNVNEWVADIYRPMNSIDMDDFNPYRGNNTLDGDDINTSNYETNANTLISNKSRVYKGGSWQDRPYWLNPGTRRFLDEDKSASTIGFRCAVSAFGMDSPGANENPKPGLWNRIKRLFNLN